MKALAEEIASKDTDFFRLGEISWDKFEDGFPNLFIKNVDDLRGQNCVFLASFLDHKELLAQLSGKNWLMRVFFSSKIKRFHW